MHDSNLAHEVRLYYSFYIALVQIRIIQIPTKCDRIVLGYTLDHNINFYRPENSKFINGKVVA